MQNKHLPVERLNQLRLLEDPSKIRRSKTGSIKGYAGKVKGDELLASNPFEWFTSVFKPAAEKAGVKTLSDQVMLLNQTLPSTAANLGRILLQQKETIKQHGRNTRNAATLDQAIENQKSDPKSTLKEFGAAIDDFNATILSAEPVAVGLHSMATAIRDFAGYIKDHKGDWDIAKENHPWLKGADATKPGKPFGEVFGKYRKDRVRLPSFVEYEKEREAGVPDGMAGIPGRMKVGTRPFFAETQGATPTLGLAQLAQAKTRSEDLKKAMERARQVKTTGVEAKTAQGKKPTFGDVVNSFWNNLKSDGPSMFDPHSYEKTHPNEITRAKPKSSGQAHESLGVTVKPMVDVSGYDRVKEAAEAAKQAHDGLNVTAVPEIDATSVRNLRSEIESAHSALRAFLTDLAKAGSLTVSMNAGVPNVNIPSLRSMRNGDFRDGGVQGE